MFEMSWSSFAFGLGIGVALTVGTGIAIRSRKPRARRASIPSAPIPATSRTTAKRSDEHHSSGPLADDRPELSMGGGSDGSWWMRARGTAALIVVLLLIAAFIWWKSCDRDRGQEPVQPPTATAKPDPPTVVVNIYLELQKGMSRPRFDARPHVRQDVVKGKQGRYYLVRLKDANAQEMVFFEGGQFQKDEFGPQLNSAIDAFRGEVTAALAAGGVQFQMFVRGSADIVDDDKEYIGLLLPGETKTIEYYPALDKSHNEFAPELKTHVVTRSYANRDLPNLRAAYIRDRLADNGLKSIILDGLVTKEKNESDRNVTMLLFVAWPELDASRQ